MQISLCILPNNTISVVFIIPTKFVSYLQTGLSWQDYTHFRFNKYILGEVITHVILHCSLTFAKMKTRRDVCEKKVYLCVSGIGTTTSANFVL